MTAPRRTGIAGRSPGHGCLFAGAGYTPALPVALACRFWTRSDGRSTARPRSPMSAGRSPPPHLCGDSAERAQPVMLPRQMVGQRGHRPWGTARQDGILDQPHRGSRGRVDSLGCSKRDSRAGSAPQTDPSGDGSAGGQSHRGQCGHSTRDPFTFGSGQPGGSRRPSQHSLSANLIQLGGSVRRLRGGAEPCGRQRDGCRPRAGPRHPLPRTPAGRVPPASQALPSLTVATGRAGAAHGIAQAALAASPAGEAERGAPAAGRPPAELLRAAVLVLGARKRLGGEVGGGA